jgi:hypothetical protein
VFDGPHSMVVGWPLDELGPLLCGHLNLEYDENWRHSDSQSTWHLSVEQWIEGIELLISYNENDWSEIKDGRFILGVIFGLEGADDLEGVEFFGLRDFNKFAKQNNIQLPRASVFFYDGEESFGWAVDTSEWEDFKKRVK